MKKGIPLAIRKLLEKLITEKSKIFKTEFDEKFVFKLVDIDPDSDFYFLLEKQIFDKQNVSYVMEYKPSSDIHLNSLRIGGDFEKLKEHIDVWYNLVYEMNQSSIVFDDPIVQSYYDELEPQFEILEEDAEIVPFKIVQQRIVLTYLERATEIINQADISSEDKEDLNKSVQELKSTISKSTKKDVIKKVRKFIAKGLKFSYVLGEKLLIEFTTELAKKLITGT